MNTCFSSLLMHLCGRHDIYILSSWFAHLIISVRMLVGFSDAKSSNETLG